MKALKIAVAVFLFAAYVAVFSMPLLLMWLGGVKE